MARVILEVVLVYGNTGHMEFDLHIGDTKEGAKAFSTLGWRVTPLLADLFEEIGFDPERYEHCQSFYSPVDVQVKSHTGNSALRVTYVLEFYNGKGLGQFGKTLKKVSKKRGKGFISV